MQQGEALKDAYDQAYIARLGAALAGSFAELGLDFDTPGFAAAVFAEECEVGWSALELKGRMVRIADVLDAVLPDDLAAAIEVLVPVVPEFGGYQAMIFPAVVELRGMRGIEQQAADGAWGLAVAALARFTEYSSSEFAVRPLILRDQARMLAEMQRWTADANHHVRRLASEGCRPRLPWAMALPPLKRDPGPLLPILEALRDDESEYVRRSVANNLNDIAKDHPNAVLEVAERWLEAGACSEERRRLVKHACRTLLKAGEPRAMRLFGFRDPKNLAIESLELDRETLKIGDSLEFRFRLVVRAVGRSRSKTGSVLQTKVGSVSGKKTGSPSVGSAKALGRVRLEYAVYYQKKNGTLAPKVFKISEFDSAETSRDVVRKHAFRELSTRRLHPGPHALELRINGVPMARAEFVLEL